MGVRVGQTGLDGRLTVVESPQGFVLFARVGRDGGSDRRDRRIARNLHRAGYSTLWIDLLTPAEQLVDRVTSLLRYDASMLGMRIAGVLDWLREREVIRGLTIGLYGAGNGAAASLAGAAERPGSVASLVGCGGAPEFAGDVLPDVRAPTLLITGGDDPVATEFSESALQLLACTKRLSIVEGATRLLTEPGAADSVEHLTASWFAQTLAPRASSALTADS